MMMINGWMDDKQMDGWKKTIIQIVATCGSWSVFDRFWWFFLNSDEGSSLPGPEGPCWKAGNEPRPQHQPAQLG